MAQEELKAKIIAKTMDNLNSCNDVNILVYLERFTRLYIKKYTEGSGEQ